MPRDLPSSHTHLPCPTDVAGKPAGCSTLLGGAITRTASISMKELEVQHLRRRQLRCLLPDRQEGLAELQLAGGIANSSGPRENADEDLTVYSDIFVSRRFRMLALQSRLQK